MLVHLIPHAIRLVKEYPWLLPVVLGYLAVSAWLGFTFLLVATIVATLGLGAVLWYRDYKDSKREYRVVIRDPHGAPIYDTYRGRRPRDFGKGARTDSSRLFVLDDGDDGGEIIRGLVWPPVFLRGPPAAASKKSQSKRADELPARFTQAWIERAMPRLDAAQAAHVIAVMRARGWSEDELHRRVYPHMR